MKERISATVEKDTIKQIDSILKKGRYRNKSHIIEKAIELIAKEDKNEK
jgi:Arc/MetJ-type ribon-helix-helix transcriptional regulator